jgi:predicted GIY-YIG superfamily endonuclease
VWHVLYGVYAGMFKQRKKQFIWDTAKCLVLKASVLHGYTTAISIMCFMVTQLLLPLFDNTSYCTISVIWQQFVLNHVSHIMEKYPTLRTIVVIQLCYSRNFTTILNTMKRFQKKKKIQLHKQSNINSIVTATINMLQTQLQYTSS